MKMGPFNSLDQALAKAEVQKKEAEKARTPIFLIVGLDFGTAFTKCMVRDFNYRRATPIAFNCRGEQTFFLPSELGVRAGDLIHPLDGIPEGTPVLSFLKMALAAAASGVRSDWLDGVTRTLGITDTHRQTECVRALVVLYITRTLEAIHDFITERWDGFGQIPGDTVFYNMAVPVAHAREESVLNAFRECLNVAVTLIRIGKPLPRRLDELVRLVEQHLPARLDVCDLIPEVTANVQSYVRSRGGKTGLYLFADVGAGTIDYSVFIYFQHNGDRSLTYPHAAVEHLGSSQLEIRTFQRSRAALTNHLRMLKEGVARNGEWRIDLGKELDTSRKELEGEITDATERVIALTRRKLRRGQFQQMQILFGGGGCSKDPYMDGVEAAFKPCWGLSPTSQPLPVPADIDLPAKEGPSLFRRLSVAYGLSFLPTDAPIQRFPDEVDELDPNDRPRREFVAAPSKDEV
jgi:hypothetical protein